MMLTLYEANESSLKIITEWFKNMYGIKLNRSQCVTAAIHNTTLLNSLVVEKIFHRKLALHQGKMITVSDNFRVKLAQVVDRLPLLIPSYSYAMNFCVLSFALSLPNPELVQFRDEIQVQIKKREVKKSSPFAERYQIKSLYPRPSDP